MFLKKKTPKRQLKQASPKRSIFSYSRPESSAGSNSKSPFSRQAAKPAKGKGWLSRLISVLLVSVLTALFLYSLLLNAPPKLSLANDPYLSTENYQLFIIEIFNELKNQNKITLDESAISEKIKNVFPEVTAVEIKTSVFGRSPTVNISVANPSFVLSTSNQKYIVDSLGFVAGDIASLGHIKDLPLVVDESGFSAKVGEQILSQRSVNFINEVLAHAKQSKIKVSELRLPASAQELHIKTSDTSYYTKLYLGGSSAQQVGQWLAARNQFAESKQQPSRYLDVRVEGKIFYR